MTETKKIILPENVADITLEQFVAFNKLQERRGSLDDLAYTKRFISIFSGIRFKNLRHITLEGYTNITDQIIKALDTEVPFENKFTLNGIEYGFVPDLDEITTGEYVDLSTCGTDHELLHRVMAILFRPIVSTDPFGNYVIAQYNGTKKTEEIMKKAPMSIVNGMLVFFCNLSKELEKTLKEYTEMNQEVVRKDPLITLRGGDGTQQ
tara:strand:+ start:413 stop:1033 length:621 start_codon:yes stop_codon:yes gene_type:complete